VGNGLKKKRMKGYQERGGGKAYGLNDVWRLKSGPASTGGKWVAKQTLENAPEIGGGQSEGKERERGR